MQYNFSNRFKNLKPSPAGDILAMMGDPTLIKFSITLMFKLITRTLYGIPAI